MKHLLGFVVLAMCVVLPARAAEAVYDISATITTGARSIPMVGGQELGLKSPLSEGDKVLFIDTMPDANWGHPAFVRVLSAAGKLREEIKTNRPPEKMGAVISHPFGPLDGRAPTFNVKDLDGKYKVEEPQRYYALLINGRAELRHWNDFSFLYRTLTTVYGYKKENIWVADSAFKSRNADLDGDGWDDIQYGSTLGEIRAVIAELASKIQENDQLVLVINDHGSTRDGESTLVLSDGEMGAREFGELLKTLPVKSLLAVYEQCFSGGFVRPSAGGKRVAMAASTDSEYSFASMDLMFNEFLYHVIAAFAHQTHEGTPLSADRDSNGEITAQEAYAYAVAQDRRRESPFLESGSNAGGAQRIGIGFIR
ncbi:MAG: caspase family protein [Bdellovibrionales bacterium]|nr:caspase family protein [Bdellovibrionales bacterium]